jgi:putative membrane protein
MMGTGLMGWGGYGGFGSYGWIGMIINLVITVVVIVGIFWLIRRALSMGQFSSGPASAVQSAREILQTRYARGEITREQYQQILADLN